MIRPASGVWVYELERRHEYKYTGHWEIPVLQQQRRNHGHFSADWRVHVLQRQQGPELHEPKDRHAGLHELLLSSPEAAAVFRRPPFDLLHSGIGSKVSRPHNFVLGFLFVDPTST